MPVAQVPYQPLYWVERAVMYLTAEDDPGVKHARERRARRQQGA